MTDQEQKAMQMALEALEDLPALSWIPEKLAQTEEAIEALRQALNVDAIDISATCVDETEKREHEPVAWMQIGVSDEYKGVVLPTMKKLKEYNRDLWRFEPLYTAPPSKPDDLLRQSEQEGWRWAKECEEEVKRLRTLLAEGGQGCGECGVKASNGYALYCVKCVLPMKEWIGLTDEERSDVIVDIFGNIFAAPQKSLSLARAIEAKLKEKNA